jgi:hypothetical protein
MREIRQSGSEGGVAGNGDPLYNDNYSSPLAAIKIPHLK